MEVEIGIHLVWPRVQTLLAYTIQPYWYCIHRNFSDLTIIAIIATGRKPAIKVVAIFSITIYLIYKLEGHH